MPIYEYVCEQCDNHIELMQKITEEPLKTCPHCKGQVRKMISNTSFVLKGTGWYVTDYASNKKDSESKTPEAKTEKESSTKPTETKSETKEPAAASSK